MLALFLVKALVMINWTQLYRLEKGGTSCLHGSYIFCDEGDSMSAAAPVVELKQITKRFPGIVANDSISLTLKKGEILALLGENGEGKSTLMNIVFGLYQPDEGSI